MSRSTKIKLILAAIGQSILYTFGIMGVLRITCALVGIRMQQPIAGSLFLFTVVMINTVCVTLCVKQINRAKSLPAETPSISE